MDTVVVNGKHFQGAVIPLPGCALLLLRGERAILGCGYLSVDAANQFGHALAIVRGVSNYEEMLSAPVANASAAALAKGVLPGKMTGREALLKMEAPEA